MPATLLLSSPSPRGHLKLQHTAAAWGNLRPTQLPGLRSVVRSAKISSPVLVVAQQDSGQDVPDTSAPKPRTAWNKGQKMAASSRRKLSQALKKKWKDPEHRNTVSEKLKGLEPWNKGRTLSEETRLKMSLAKRNRTVSKATRQRMSASHRGKTHSQETTQLLSQMATGQPKSAEHIANISAGQRRRHAAARVLRAVEAVYEAQGATASGGNGNGVESRPVTAQVTAAAAAIDPAAPSRSSKQAEPSASGAAAAAAVSDAQGGANLAAMQSLQASRLAAYRVAGGNSLASSGAGASSSGGSKKRRMSRAQILAEYKAELQEYRALQEELSPWSNAFVEKNGRKPGMQDVLATGIVWLITRYKQYILLRDRLFTDTGTLRSRLDGAIPDMDMGMQSINSQGAAASQAASLNANGAAGARSAAAARFSAAMEYKAARKAGGAAAAPKQQDERQQQAVPAQAAAAGAAPLQQQQRPEAEAAGAGSALEEGPLLSPNVPPRVRLAMMAAQEFRQKKAQATKALATAAAAAAKAGFSSPRPTQAAGTAPSSNGTAPGSVAGAPSQGSSAAAVSAVLASGAAAAASGAAAAASAAAAAVSGSVNGHPSSGSAGANGHDSAAAAPAVPAALALSGRRAAERRHLPAVELPAEVALTQAAAHAAVEEARRAEDSMRRALQLSTASIDEEIEGARHEVGFA